MCAASVILSLLPQLPERLMKDADGMSRRRIGAIAKRRLLGHWLAVIGPAIGSAMMRGSGRQGSARLHTLMEGVATLLALMVGAMARVRVYNGKNGALKSALG